MKHVSGYTGCSSEDFKARLGAWQFISAIVTDSDRNIIFPNPQILKNDTYYRYTMRGYNSKTSKAITYTELHDPLYVEEHTELQVWFGEDLKDIAEGDNFGTHCVDLYAQIVDKLG